MWLSASLMSQIGTSPKAMLLPGVGIMSVEWQPIAGECVRVEDLSRSREWYWWFNSREKCRAALANSTLSDFGACCFAWAGVPDTCSNGLCAHAWSRLVHSTCDPQAR